MQNFVGNVEILLIDAKYCESDEDSISVYELRCWKKTLHSLVAYDTR